MPGYHNPAVPLQQQQHPYYQHPYPAQAHSPSHSHYGPYYHPAHYGYPQPDGQGRMGHRVPYPQDNHRYPMYATGVYQPMAYPMPHRAYQPEMSPYAGRVEPPQPQHAHPPQQPMVVSSNQYAGQQFTPIARSSPAPHTPRLGPPSVPDRSTQTPASTTSVSTTPVSTTPSTREGDSREVQRRPSQSTMSRPCTTATMISSSQESNSTDATQSSAVLSPVSPQSGTRMPFYPQLPWYSEKTADFPKRTRRRRKRRDVESTQGLLPVPVLASEQQTESADPVDITAEAQAANDVDSTTQTGSQREEEPAHAANAKTPVEPSAPLPPSTSTTQKPSHTRNPTIPAVPLIPIKPLLPKAARKNSASTITSGLSHQQKPTSSTPAETLPSEATSGPEVASQGSATSEAGDSTTGASKPTPKSWAELVRAQNSKAAAPSPSVTTNGAAAVNGFSSAKAGSLAEALSAFTVDSESKIPFLKPRGLVNMGNMCYMNSILQILVFCVPFYDFLDRVGKKAAHSFKSETPLLDTMIMFMREFPVIDSASSVDQLCRRLKEEEFEQYGDAFLPDFVYDTIKRLPRFATMRTGHQQDAEEFLGFLLEGLHDECAAVLKTLSGTNAAASPASATGGWQEVAPKQKASVTRSSGAGVVSPITKIFGGQLRSELRVPGLKNSVTLEPYQPLQLDIGAGNVNNIIDALKGLTRPETIVGDFNSPRGPGANATKQVFIETLPPVLILHLKRFQYDSSGGTQKIYKRVGYPLELEIPKEVFPPTKRNTILLNNKGVLPRYRLVGVVYHHGKNASGGHYTVDVRRQDGHEWIRMDDTVIRRVRPEDIADYGAEEDPKVLTTALEQHKRDSPEAKGNMWDVVSPGEGEETNEEEVKGGWKDAKANGKKWSGVATNGTGSGKNTPLLKEAKDKVPYILFYQEIKP